MSGKLWQRFADLNQVTIAIGPIVKNFKICKQLFFARSD